MKVVILAGGFGTRLGKITETIPKPMVRIGNKPIIWHIMNYYSSFGYNDFVICLGYKGEIIKEYFINYTYYNSDFTIDYSNDEIKLYQPNNIDWKVTLVDTGLNTLKGGRLKRVEKYLDDINFLTYGDGLSNIDITALLNFHKENNKIITISGVNPPSRFGEISIDENNLVGKFTEKPQVSTGLINGGFMVFNKELLNYLDLECDLETEVFNKLVDDKNIVIYKHQGYWECMDNERDLIHLEKIWNLGKAPWAVK
ncbi:MAG: glucose-1-phosphate cytidylyltransferase [Candidatus Heimdallarchaeota archaeon]|nr:glucose-1-phosphate cytidylyltransferase [Candidatus Heimdallarchaeota archaeon]